jgi:hypothetical protein
MRMCQIVIWGLPCSAVFFHIISQTGNFRNKVFEHECLFWFSLQLLSEMFISLYNLHLQRTASKCESSPTFYGLAPSQSSGYYWCLSQSYQAKESSDDGDGVIPWNPGEFSHLNAALCPRRSLFIGVLVKVTKPRNPLTMGTESFHETLENFHTLTQLSAREDPYLLVP